MTYILVKTWLTYWLYLFQLFFGYERYLAGGIDFYIVFVAE